MLFLNLATFQDRISQNSLQTHNFWTGIIHMVKPKHQWCSIQTHPIERHSSFGVARSLHIFPHPFGRHGFLKTRILHFISFFTSKLQQYLSSYTFQAYFFAIPLPLTERRDKPKSSTGSLHLADDIILFFVPYSKCVYLMRFIQPPNT